VRAGQFNTLLTQDVGKGGREREKAKKSENLGENVE
jgi:hypothetical protein